MNGARSCSRSRPGNAWLWPDWFRRSPTLVAESLSTVRDPLSVWLRPPPVAPPEAVAAALARALLPPEAEAAGPRWLRADQRLSFRRAVAAIQRFNGVMLADGVGTGKTWIALAVASTLEPGRAIPVLAPAALFAQWRETARRAGVPLRLHSHETLSRGRLPAAGGTTVIIDESHRFRSPSTRRYLTLAPWCVGRRGILLSATPAVNRLEDVARQLLLFVRDDALAWNGVPSLLAGLERSVPDALASLVVTGEDRSRSLPLRVSREVRPEEPENSPFWSVFHGILGLTLSERRVVASLVRVVLLQALASSPAATALALSRYRALLVSARDAEASGHQVSRNAIRRLVGADIDQLVLWPLVAETASLPELALSDLEALDAPMTACRAWSAGRDVKLAELARLVSAGGPTLVFTTHTATVRYLRAGLGRPRVAWCTGSHAGLDTTTLPREVVLDWFRRDALGTDRIQPRPSILIATDVAAEGLDLPLIRRVVHYDLPWTAVRLDQRSGRAFRLGSLVDRVEVVRVLPPAALEAALGKEAILDAKAELPRALGLGTETHAPWRLRAQVAAEWAGVEAAEGSATMEEARAAVAGIRIIQHDGSSRAIVLARGRHGWVADAATIAGHLVRARGSATAREADPTLLRSVIRSLAGAVRAALRAGNGVQLAAHPKSPLLQAAMRRLMLLARRAASIRATERLRLLSAGLGFLRRGLTAGESRMAEEWVTLGERELFAALARLPVPEAVAPAQRVELIGLLIV